MSELVSIRNRTPEVIEGILASVSEKTGYEVGVDSITDKHLKKITSLDLGHKNISNLKAGDFEGLTGLNRNPCRRNNSFWRHLDYKGG